MGHWVAAVALLCALWSPAGAVAASDATFPGESWEEPPPASTGWSADKLQAADELARSMSTDAYLVVHRGVLVHKFGKVTQPMNLASVRKSVLSVLYGIGIDRNEIDLNKTMADWASTQERSVGHREHRHRAPVCILRRLRPGGVQTASMKADADRGSPPAGNLLIRQQLGLRRARHHLREGHGKQRVRRAGKGAGPAARLSGLRPARDTRYARSGRPAIPPT